MRDTLLLCSTVAMRYFLLTFFLICIWNCCLSQDSKRTILISIPEQAELQEDIYNQLVTKWDQTDHKGIWNEEDMRNLARISGESVFPREYIERKFSKLGYQVNWKNASELRDENEFDFNGELGRQIKIHKSGGQSVSTYLKIFDSKGNLIADGEPHLVYKILKKGA